jgi:hypothetical protein
MATKCLGCLQGLIQSVFELHDGSGIVVTVGKYVTPDHKDINGNGLEPDYNRLPGSIFEIIRFLLWQLKYMQCSSRWLILFL